VSAVLKQPIGTSKNPIGATSRYLVPLQKQTRKEARVEVNENFISLKVEQDKASHCVLVSLHYDDTEHLLRVTERIPGSALNTPHPEYVFDSYIHLLVSQLLNRLEALGLLKD
jgi:hypothetical protein